jgi:glycosyltransferase involved in cell wall biosynthesis
MFVFDLSEPPSQSPALAPISERMRQLGRGRRRVAYVYPSPNQGTFRYRVLNMLEALSLDPEIGASWFNEAEVCCLGEVLTRADVIVLCHCRYTPALANLIIRARAMGRRVLFDIDDLVFDTRYVPLVLHYLDHPTDEGALDHWFGNFSRYGELMRLCDDVIVTNDYLAARARDFTGHGTLVIPNFMGNAQLRVSASILAAKRRVGYRRNGVIHLGYFSGSRTHRRDLEVAEHALVEILCDDARVRLRLVGEVEISDALKPYERRIEKIPLQDPLQLQRLIGEVEINLAPLAANAFTNCKSELKFFEAAAVGTLTVASPTYTFRSAIEHGRTGLLASAQQWVPVLEEALNDLPRAVEMADAAAEAVGARYNAAAQAPGIRTALFGEPQAPTGRRRAD